MDVTQTTPLPNAQTPSAGSGVASDEVQKTVISSDFETFLKMLTAQMENQDPLNPIESTDYATQLATFSGVEQQVQTNDLLKSLGSQMGVMGMAQLSGWVGMEGRAAVSVPFDGSPITLDPVPRSVADKAFLVVRDATGAEVQRSELNLSGGAMDWVGVASDGNPLPYATYSFEVENHSQGAVIGSDPVPVYAEIQEARMEDGRTVLIFEGGAKLAADEVTAIRKGG
ncbi:MAG: flagellar hook capping FlgD N-terminal domain-containing protein [Pseudomonadota bacterium]